MDGVTVGSRCWTLPKTDLKENWQIYRENFLKEINRE